MSRRAVRAFAAMTSLVVFESAAIAALHRLGSLSFLRIDLAHPLAWAQSNPAVDSIASIARMAGLLIAYWMAAVTAAHVVARVTRCRPPSWLTIPLLRRVVDVAIATAITAGLTAPPALAAQDDDRPATVVTERLLARSRPPIIPPGVAAAGFSVGTGTAGRAPSATRHEVVSGDSLWSIAGRHLEVAIGTVPTTHQISGYWREVVEANRSLIRSGDPDLIFPGEEVILPPVPGDALTTASALPPASTQEP